MRKILLQLMLLPLLILSACSDDDKGDSTIIIAKDQQNQTAFADDTDKTIRFTATQDWRTEVDYTGTKATDAAEKWVTLDPPSGEAGEVTVKVTLSTNYTGADRRATIRIVCGGTTITVIIEQKGLDEEGNIPDEDHKPDVTPRIITRMIQHEEAREYHADFTYDELLRLKTLKSYNVGESTHEMLYNWTVSYFDDRLVLEFSGYDEGTIQSDKETYTLKDGRVISCISTEGGRKTFEYDTEGRMTKYVEFDNGAITLTYKMTWEGNLVTTMTETYGSVTKVSKYEYYDKETVPVNAVSLDLIQLVIDEGWLVDYIPDGFYGQPMGQYVKKVTITDEQPGYDEAIYRYETNADGYITKVYRRWTPAGESTREESLNWEIIYQ